VLLAKLSPAERAAYVLREAFDYSYRQIANILEAEEANVRQLVSRARKHIVDGRRTPVTSSEQRRLLEAFIVASQRGDMAPLEGLFAEGVPCSDSGAIGRAKRVVERLATVVTSRRGVLSSVMHADFALEGAGRT
jgi:RNA polymerase sigma-70 factor (ECF subfamily)